MLHKRTVNTNYAVVLLSKKEYFVIIIIETYIHLLLLFCADNKT